MQSNYILTKSKLRCNRCGFVTFRCFKDKITHYNTYHRPELFDVKDFGEEQKIEHDQQEFKRLPEPCLKQEEVLKIFGIEDIELDSFETEVPYTENEV